MTSSPYADPALHGAQHIAKQISVVVEMQKRSKGKARAFYAQQEANYRSDFAAWSRNHNRDFGITV